MAYIDNEELNDIRLTTVVKHLISYILDNKKGDMSHLQKAELVVKKDDCYTIPKALEFTNQTTVGALKKQVERKRKADKMALKTRKWMKVHLPGNYLYIRL